METNVFSPLANEPETPELLISGIDIDKGISMTGGKFNIYIRVLTVYYIDSTERINIIKQCLETDDLKTFIINIHTLKSASANIGAFKLADDAKALEDAGEVNDLPALKTQILKFITDLEKLLQDINEVISAYR